MTYTNSLLNDYSTEKPDALIETTFDYSSEIYELHEYNIVPISAGGIVGLVFASICGLIILVILCCVVVRKMRNSFQSQSKNKSNDQGPYHEK